MRLEPLNGKPVELTWLPTLQVYHRGLYNGRTTLLNLLHSLIRSIHPLMLYELFQALPSGNCPWLFTPRQRGWHLCWSDCPRPLVNWKCGSIDDWTPVTSCAMTFIYVKGLSGIPHIINIQPESHNLFLIYLFLQRPGYGKQKWCVEVSFK